MEPRKEKRNQVERLGCGDGHLSGRLVKRDEIKPTNLPNGFGKLGRDPLELLLFLRIWGADALLAQGNAPFDMQGELSSLQESGQGKEVAGTISRSLRWYSEWMRVGGGPGGGVRDHLSTDTQFPASSLVESHIHCRHRETATLGRYLKSH